MNRGRALTFAVIITIIGVPLLLFFDRRPSDSATPATIVDSGTPDVLGTAPLPFDEVTVPPSSPGPPVIAVPDIPEGVPMKATYSSSISSSRSCMVGSTEVPFGIDINIRNVNNNRSIRCTNSIQATVDQEGVVVLPLAAYVKIADVTDAPVPIEITW